jgi:predicted Zn-dependent peptidase
MLGADSVSFGLYFPTGSRHESVDNNGISHFIEHMVFKGTRTRSAEEINREIDLLGGGSNAYTGKETLCLHSRVLAEHLPRAVALFADLAAHALPSGVDSDGVDSEMEREREVILSEISAVEDSPEDLVGDLCDRAYFGEHPLALPVAGSVRAVARLNSSEIRAHFARHIVAHDMVVAAAGQVDHEALLALARQHLEAIPRGAPQPALLAPSVQYTSRVLERDLEQVHVCLSAPGVSRGEGRRRTAELLSLIVGDGYSSRLFREVRDRRGLAYSIYASLASYLDAGSFNIYFAVAPEKLDETLEVVGQVLADVRGGGLSADELEAAKLHLRTSTVLGQEFSGARMAFLAEQVMLGDRELSLSLELDAIQHVSLAELRELAADLLAGPLALAAVGHLTPDRFARTGWEIPA